jgi:hypothetical protein
MSSSEERSFTYTAENGDTIHEVYRIENLGDNHKRESVDKYINGRFISLTITDFINGYKHGYQTINKENGNGTSQNFINYYENGYMII